MRCATASPPPKKTLLKCNYVLFWIARESNRPYGRGRKQIVAARLSGPYAACSMEDVLEMANFSARNRLALAMLVSASAVSLSSAAFAQSVAPEEPSAAVADGADSAEITVTGSRISRDGFSTPTPVTALNEEQLVQTAPSTVADALRAIPALVNTSGPQRNSGTTNGGQAFLNLRSLGAERTLTLLDGRRFVTSALTGSVDANLIPSALIERVDIVTGGASAAYGSDAVAGVVNFILNKTFSGAKLDAHYGITDEGDNQEYKISGAVGTAFAGGRGHIVVAGEYYDTEGARPENRDWSRRGYNFINGPAGGPTRILSPNVLTVGTFGGMILNGNGGTAAANAAIGGVQFLPGGTIAPYSFGSYRSGSQQIGGDGVNSELYQELARPLNRQNIFGRAQFEISSDVTAFVEGQYGLSKTDYVNGTNRNQIGNTLTIRPDNAYLPVSIRNQMLASGVTSLTFVRHSRERGYVHTQNEASTYRYVVGAEGKIADWKWNVYYQHGRSKQNNDILNMMNVPRMNLAVDAVVSGGQIVCRSTLTNPTNGCVPFNVFGEGAPSTAALDYVFGTSNSVSTLDMDNVAANFSGDLMQGWAGPISLAFGAEYRRDKAVVTADDESKKSAWLFGNPQPWSGAANVKEAYVETQIPLLADQAMFDSLDLNAAYRIADYSTSGSISSWKLGLNYVPFKGLRFRGTRSRDIRAPNVNELFSAGRQFTATVNDPFKSNVVVAGLPFLAQGNRSLMPEVANTLTVGAVIEPVQIPGLSLSVDYYDIKVRDAISTVSAQQLVDQCFAGNQFACSQTERNASGNLVRIYQTPINLASAVVNGVDFETAYRTSAGTILGPDTQFSIRTVVSYLGKLQTVVPGSPAINRAGEVGLSPTPHWSGNTQIRLSGDNAGVFLQGRLIGGGKYDVTKTAADLNLLHINPVFYLDAQVSYKLPVMDRGVEVYFDVRNLLDRDPPVAPANANIAMATNSSLYDLLGRTFRLGLRVRY